MNTGRWLALAGLLWLGASVRADENAPDWFARLHPVAGVEFGYTENISRTSFEPTRKDAATLQLELAGSLPRQLAPSLLLVADFGIESLAVRDFALTNHLTATSRLTLQKKFGLGPQAWVLRTSAGAGYKQARLADDRGWNLEAGVELAKRILPNLRVAANAQWVEHDAASAVFDLDQHRYGLDARWDFAARWSLSASAARLAGDVVANAAPAVWSQMLAGAFGPTIFNYYTSRPSDVTNLYGAGWVSYNVEGDVDMWSVSLGYALSERATLDLTHAGLYFVNRAGVAYPANTWSLRLNYRF